MKKLDRDTLVGLLSAYGLGEGDVTFLGGGREESDGIVYTCQYGGRLMALKIMAWTEPTDGFADTRARLALRLRFAGMLLQGGAPVVGPVPDGDGLLWRASHAGDTGYITYLMPLATGRNVPPDAWDEGFLRRWGAAIGRMHRLTVGYKEGFRCTAQDSAGQPLLGWQRELRDFWALCQDEDVKDRWLDVEGRLLALPQERSSFGLIHNDPHVQNVLDDGQTLSVIDFDVANYHWFVTDLSIALQSVLFMVSGGMERPLQDSEAVARFLRHLLAGYRQEYDLPVQWLEQLDLFLHYRRLLLFTVMQDWLATEPDARAGWKQMILDEPAVVRPLVEKARL